MRVALSFAYQSFFHSKGVTKNPATKCFQTAKGVPCLRLQKGGVGSPKKTVGLILQYVLFNDGLNLNNKTEGVFL